jgi:hypothetical protein
MQSCPCWDRHWFFDPHRSPESSLRLTAAPLACAWETAAYTRNGFAFRREYAVIQSQMRPETMYACSLCTTCCSAHACVKRGCASTCGPRVHMRKARLRFRMRLRLVSEERRNALSNIWAFSTIFGSAVGLRGSCLGSPLALLYC